MAGAYNRECDHAGLDPKDIARIARRLDKVMADAKKLGLSLFCGGSSPSLRVDDGSPTRRLLIVGHCDFNNADGGDGGYCEDGDGLLRGE